jgi:hypothetical protein
MKWLIVEDALRDRRGHWLEYVSTFVRGLRALGDEVVVLCDLKAEGFILEQTGARPVLPESIWHRMGDGAGALERYARVPGHALATFVAMRKFFRSFDHRGHREHRGGGGKFSHGGMANTEMGAGLRPGSRAGAVFSNPSTSELARDSENTALSRCASGPVSFLPATSYPLSATSSPLDWIFVPTVLVHHLLGWWWLIKSGSVPKEARVLLFFPNLPIGLDGAGRAFWTAGPTTKLMAWLFGRLRNEVEGGRVVLGVETHAMRRALEGLIGMRVVYLPHPVEVPAEARRRGEGIAAKKLTTEDTESTEDQFVQKQGGAWASQAGAAFSNPSASGLARDCENTSPNRSAIDSASALDAGRSSLDSKTSAKPIVFGCYGAARWEKGSDVLQAAIRLVLQKAETLKAEPVPVGAGREDCRRQAEGRDERERTSQKLKKPDAGRPALDSETKSAARTARRSMLESLRFAIQWVEDFRDQEGNLVSIDPWLREHPQVEVIGRYFQGDEYERRLAGTDVMVLPYRSPYRLRVSRVVIEAMIHGMPVVATGGTTLFEQAQEYGVVVGCEEGSAESLARAILEVAEGFGVMREAAEQKAEMVARSFSVGYFRELLGKVGK